MTLTKNCNIIINSKYIFTLDLQSKGIRHWIWIWNLCSWCIRSGNQDLPHIFIQTEDYLRLGLGTGSSWGGWSPTALYGQPKPKSFPSTQFKHKSKLVPNCNTKTKSRNVKIGTQGGLSVKWVGCLSLLTGPNFCFQPIPQERNEVMRYKFLNFK